MQRLIVEYITGDDCTYTSTNTHPALGESPAAYLEALEAQWIEQVLKHKDLVIQEDLLLQKFHKLCAKEHGVEKLTSMRDELTAVQRAIKQCQSLTVGGCQFDLFDLAYWPRGRDRDPEFSAPRVFDLDLYFQSVEARTGG